MPTLKLTLRILTPLIMMGAANQRSDNPELRAPSFRGVFRYWLRALLGCHVQSDLEALSAFEEKVFGSASYGSPVTFRVKGTPASSQHQQVLPLNTQGVDFTAFDPSQDFRLTLKTHPLQMNFAPIVLGTTLLTLRLGAFGKRSRRGGGSLLVQRATVHGDDQLAEQITQALQTIPSDSQRLKSYLGKDIDFAMRSAAAFVGKKRYVAFSGLPTYPVLLPEHAKVLVGEPHASYEDALAAMWRIRAREEYRRQPTFGGAQPRRASAVHMRISASRALDPLAYHPVITIFRSAPEDRRKWHAMQDFVDKCISAGFDEIYGVGRW